MIADFIDTITQEVSSNNTKDDATDSNIGSVEIVVPLNVNETYLFAKQKNKYIPKRRGKRVRGKSKKEAEEEARKRGWGRPPRHHKGHYDQKLGKWIGPHFHPGVPEGHPFFHDHYFYLLFILPLFDFDEEET